MSKIKEYEDREQIFALKVLHFIYTLMGTYRAMNFSIEKIQNELGELFQHANLGIKEHQIYHPSIEAGDHQCVIWGNLTTMFIENREENVEPEEKVLELDIDKIVNEAVDEALDKAIDNVIENVVEEVSSKLSDQISTKVQHAFRNMMNRKKYRDPEGD